MEIKEMIEVLKAFEEGKEIERLIGVENNVWTVLDYNYFDFVNQTYRIKPQLTREEITKNWVKDNNIVVGSKVKVTGVNREGYFNHEKTSSVYVKDILSEFIYVKFYENDYEICETFPIESLEPYKEEMIPFTFEDKELLRGKWIRYKGDVNEHMINFIGQDNAVSCANWKQRESLVELFNTHEFIDGTPFGKLQ